LATAISALNTKRQNSKSLPAYGLVGNQALNDINALLQLFQDPSKTFDNRALNSVSEIVYELQEELGLIQTSTKTTPLRLAEKQRMIITGENRDLKPSPHFNRSSLQNEVRLQINRINVFNDKIQIQSNCI